MCTFILYTRHNILELPLQGLTKHHILSYKTKVLRLANSIYRCYLTEILPSYIVADNTISRRAALRRRPALWFIGAKMTRVIALGIVYLLIDLIAGQPSQQTCPPISDINPCNCQVKKNGLDILCEATDVSHINKAMQTLKSRQPIIFYLKLRHNNLPKLQGFFFLSLDIRHLTVHNSSLAAIEESALSSLGAYNGS